MKRFEIYLLSVISLLLVMTACEEDPTFPDPKFDSITDKHLAVRRDTADFFTIETHMDVPNGVRTIELLNAKTYAVLKTFEEYRGVKQLDFAYKVDVSNYNIDTTFTYIVKVVDMDLRTYNKAFIIDLKKFSIPEIFLMGGKTMGVAAPAVGLKALIQTGMIPIRSVTVKLDDKEVFRFDPPAGGPVTEYRMSEILYLDLAEGKDYALAVEVMDEKNRGTKEVIKVKRVEMARPKRVVCSGEYRRTTMDLTYDEQNRLIKAIFRNDDDDPMNYNFIYNSQNMVDTIRVVYKDGAYDPRIRIFTNVYNEARQLVEVRRRERVLPIGKTEWTNGTEKVFASGFIYKSDGTIESFVAGATQIRNVSYVDGYAKGEKLLAEVWRDVLASTSDPRRIKITGFLPVYMPTFVSGLPCPLTDMYDYQGSQECSDLLFRKYVYTAHVTYLDNVPYADFAYESDSQGRLIRFVHHHIPRPGSGDADRNDTYTFIY